MWASSMPCLHRRLYSNPRPYYQDKPLFLFAKHSDYLEGCITVRAPEQVQLRATGMIRAEMPALWGEFEETGPVQLGDKTVSRALKISTHEITLLTDMSFKVVHGKKICINRNKRHKLDVRKKKNFNSEDSQTLNNIQQALSLEVLKIRKY